MVTAVPTLDGLGGALRHREELQIIGTSIHSALPITFRGNMDFGVDGDIGMGSTLSS